MADGGDDNLTGGALAQLGLAPQAQQAAPAAVPQQAAPAAAPQQAAPAAAPQQAAPQQPPAAQGQNQTNQDTLGEKVFYATIGSGIAGGVIALSVTALSKIQQNLFTSSTLIGGSEQLVNHFTGPEATPRTLFTKGLVGAMICAADAMATHVPTIEEEIQGYTDVPSTKVACAAAYGFLLGIGCAASTARRESGQGR